MSLSTVLKEWLDANVPRMEVAPNTHGDYESRRIVQPGAHRSVSVIAEVRSVTLDPKYTGIYVRTPECHRRDAVVRLFCASVYTLRSLASMWDAVYRDSDGGPIPDSDTYFATRYTLEHFAQIMGITVNELQRRLAAHHERTQGGRSDA